MRSHWILAKGRLLLANQTLALDMSKGGGCCWPTKRIQPRPYKYQQILVATIAIGQPGPLYLIQVSQQEHPHTPQDPQRTPVFPTAPGAASNSSPPAAAKLHIGFVRVLALRKLWLPGVLQSTRANHDWLWLWLSKFQVPKN